MRTSDGQLSRDWCLRNAIIERVQKEDIVRWATREEKMELPKDYPKLDKNWGIPSVWVFISSILP